MLNEEFKKKFKNIFENSNYEEKFNEEESVKKEFIYIGSDGVIYKIEVEPQEGEFYVFDKTGKQLDMFNLALVDTDGAILKNVRKAIVDQYKSQEAAAINSDSEEVKVQETAENTDKKNAETLVIKKPVVDPKTAETEKIVNKNVGEHKE